MANEKKMRKKIKKKTNSQKKEGKSMFFPQM